MTQGSEVVARDGELRAVTDLLAGGDAACGTEAATGTAAPAGSCTLLIGGVPGVGKTAFVRHLVAGWPGARGVRGVPWEAGRRYGVLAQLLRREEPIAVDAEEAAALFWRAMPAGGDSLLIAVDDAHWADHASLRALASAQRHPPAGRRLIVLLVGPGDPRDSSAETAELLTRCADRTLVLPPLQAAGVAQLAAAQGLSLRLSVTEALARHTGGIPRHILDLLEELPRSTWADFAPRLPAPAAVASPVRGALRDCGEQARALVEAVAILGGETPLRHATALLEQDIDAFAALDRAVGAGLLAISSQDGAVEVRLANEMVRAAVLDAAGPWAVARAHRRAAELTGSPEARLRHLVAATSGNDPALGKELEALAGRRADEGAWASAAQLLLDASTLTDDLLLRAARVTRAVDAVVGSGDALAAATLLPELESMRETPLRDAVLGYLAISRGRGTEAGARLGRAWDLVNPEREPEVAAVVAQRQVLHQLSRCDGDGLLGWAERTVAVVGTEHPVAIESEVIRGLGLLAAGRTGEAVASYDELSNAVLPGAQTQRAVMGRGWVETVLGDLNAARADLEGAVPTAFFGGSQRISLWALAWLARVELLAGDWPAADRAVRSGLELVASTGMVLIAPLLHWTQAQLAALRGDWTAAEAAAEAAENLARDYDIMRVPACLARAVIAEAKADYAGVLRALEPLVRRRPRLSPAGPGFFCWADSYANALVMVGEHDAAARWLEDQEQSLGQAGRWLDLARLAIARGRLHGARSQVPAALRVFDAALGQVTDTPLRLDRARITFAYGQTLRRSGKRAEADALLTSARDLYAALGADTYVARCERELRAGGVKAGARSQAPEIEDPLTPQERAVADLVARGLSNREVAAELFVSVKTVQFHLTHVYAKLGVRSRTELAAIRPA